MRVIKVGGNELSDPGFVESLASTVFHLQSSTGEPYIIVHGGGRAIASLQAQLGLETVKVDGLRVTDLASLSVAQMVLSGDSNKIIVKALLAAGLDAIGISGIDGGLLRCRKKEHSTADLGYVGEIVEVRVELLKKLAGLGLTTVLSPISLGMDGQTYNVNADEVAGAVALAVGASELDFISNVPGVLLDSKVIPSLTVRQAEELIHQGIISDGMIPKVRTALSAVEQGVQKVRIVNLSSLAAGGGTVFHAD